MASAAARPGEHIAGLQFYNGELWASQYVTGLLSKIGLRERTFELESAWNLIGGLLPWDTTSGGLRGFYQGKEAIVLASISGSAGESSYLHVVDYPGDLPREGGE